jgi:hypothetical protein
MAVGACWGDETRPLIGRVVAKPSRGRGLTTAFGPAELVASAKCIARSQAEA